MSEESPAVLVGGRWVNEKGVQRWVADPTPLAAPKPVRTRLVACPYCRAKVRETCKSSGGNPVLPHSVRLAARLCPCGDLPAPRKRYCEPCRIAALALNYQLREMRKSTRERRTEIKCGTCGKQCRNFGRGLCNRCYKREWRAAA